MKPEILLLVPTLPEIEPFLHRQKAGSCGLVVTGIGPYRCAAATQKAIVRQRPRMLILCGIAGRYPDSALAVGDVVLVGSERAADMGSFEGREFVPKFSELYGCPHIPMNAPLPVVASNSVSGAASPYVDRSVAQIENMEGAAFFDVCLREQVPFWELRAISNTVGEPFGQWNIPLATDALARAIGRLLQTAESTYRTARSSDET